MKCQCVMSPTKLPVECWQPIQGGTQRALDFMVKYGIKGIIGGGVAEGGVMDSIVYGYRDAMVRAGKTDAQPGEGLSVGFHFHLAPTVQQAMDEAQGFYEENLKMFGPLRLHRGMTEEQIEIIGDPRRAPTAGLPTIQSAVESQAFLAGPPDRVIEQLLCCTWQTAPRKAPRKSSAAARKLSWVRLRLICLFPPQLRRG